MCRPPDHRVNSAVLKRGPTSHESVQPCRHRQRRTNPASRPRTRAGSLRYPDLFTTLGIFPTRTFVVRTQPTRDLIHAPLEYGWLFRRPGMPKDLTAHNYVHDPFIQRYSTSLQRLHYNTDLT